MQKKKPEPCPACGKISAGECYGRVVCPRRRQQTAGVADGRAPMYGSSGTFHAVARFNEDS